MNFKSKSFYQPQTHSDCPLYLLFLFVLVFLFVAYLIVEWIRTRSAAEKEGYANGGNAQYTYIPSSSTPNSTIQFGVHDLLIDLSNVCGFLKVDNKLLPETDPKKPSAMKSDYSVPPTSLQLYKWYTNAVGMNPSSSVNSVLDASYSKFFDAGQLKKMRPQDISSEWIAINETQIDDQLYNTVNYFVIQSGISGRPCTAGKGLSDYFLTSIIQNQQNQRILSSLKFAYYAIIKPRFLAKLLADMYQQNAVSLTNSDKETSDSVLYVLNTMCELAGNPTLIADLSANDAAHIVDGKTIFTMDTLLVYQTVGVIYELGRFASHCAKIKTDLARFNAGYPLYLQKISPDPNKEPPHSPIQFVLKYPPDKTNCNSAANLRG